MHWEVTVEGFANHAGTTPMNMRQDALLASARLIIAVNEVINSVPGNQVGTIGKIAATPNAYNVIPGKVVMGLEIRDLVADKIETLFREIEKRAAAIATESKTTIRFERQANASKPALTDKKLQQAINTAAKALGLSTKLMQSGAGHDSQEIAAIAPVAMIFVPSVGASVMRTKNLPQRQTWLMVLMCFCKRYWLSTRTSRVCADRRGQGHRSGLESLVGQYRGRAAYRAPKIVRLTSGLPAKKPAARCGPGFLNRFIVHL
ncbi:M20/M25/M40 family metallo-hydrolase [Hymenobacter sp. BRD67]|uniref:M20/M25/M40 family metallo-hydrolase n=1 Tax=Hymenobacter sp. BRD67 TaxID=2675877 RepID=UPI0039779A3B